VDSARSQRVMKYYQMMRRVADNGTSLDQISHDDTSLKSGQPFPLDIESPFVVELVV